MISGKSFGVVFALFIVSFSSSSFSKPLDKAFTSWLEHLESDLRNKILSSGACDACKLLSFAAQVALMTNNVVNDVVHISREVCKELKIEDNRVCTEAISEFKVEVLTVVDEVFLSPSEICGSLLGPSCAHKRDPSEFWNVTIPDKKPPVKPIPPPKPGSPVSRVLQFSDIHLDFLYQEGSNPYCGEPLCCRSNDKPPDPGKPKAGKYGDYQCDIPTITFENMLQHLNATQQKFDYAIWTGDVPPHNIWNQSRADQIAALDYANKLIVEYLPGLKVFPAVGNHEGAPVNSFPPPFVTGPDSNQWLRDSLADHWKIWLPDYALPTIYKGSYYTVLLSKGFRLVSLNMNYCNNMNWWLLINNTDPAQQLQWLIDTLQEAEDNGEKVHIIGHILPGSPDCLKPWSWNYYKIVNRYQSTVTAQFFAHTHADEFEIFYDEKTRKIPTNVAFIGPSVTTYQTHNPGYRIYEVDGDYANSSRVVLNHETYILDLVEANKGNVQWKLEYNAKEAYDMPSLLPEDWNNLVHRFAANKTLFDTFYKFFWKSAPGHSCDDSCRSSMLCRLMTGRSYDTSACTLLQETFSKETMRQFQESVDMC